jgi:hypothetical protein
MAQRIWLIAADWQLRALVRAELLELGYEVTALEGWEALAERLQEELLAPGLVIVELTGSEPAGATSLLTSMPARRLVVRGGGAPAAEALQAAGVEAVISRPCQVGDVVRAAGALLGEDSTSATTECGSAPKPSRTRASSS